MKTLEFLEGVLSSKGHYCVFAARSRDDTRIQKFYDTLEEVERAALKFDADGYDAYFALSTFKEPTNRKGPNAHELKSLFLRFGLWSVERIPNAEGSESMPYELSVRSCPYPNP